MKLDLLLDGMPGISNISGSSDAQIKGFCVDPQLCKAGYLYLADESETVDSAHLGERLDGRDFIHEAIANGAIAVLTTPEVELDHDVILIKHPAPLKILGALLVRYFAQPYPHTIALVTGTDGKTSTVNFCRMFWSEFGYPACSIGNLGAQCSDGSILWPGDLVLTVPDTLTLHQLLHTLAQNNIHHVACEATSHALFDHRLTGVPASIGVFTNLTPEHLSFHQTMDEYFRVKMQLFEEVLPKGSWAVLNADSDWYEKAMSICQKQGHQIISFGFKGETLRLLKVTDNENGQAILFEHQEIQFSVQLNLHGLFQAYNVICSLGVIMASGVSIEQAIPCIPKLTEVEGRLNTVGYTPAGGRVVIDFAHTINGIKMTLEACRSFTKGKLFVILGADSGYGAHKRQELGKVASLYADQVIVTDSHPKWDDPALLRAEILSGAPHAKEVAGRPQAIAWACHMLEKGDTLLIAGMGHEKVLWVGNQKIPYSDRDCVNVVLKKMAEVL